MGVGEIFRHWWWRKTGLYSADVSGNLLIEFVAQA